ncbi:MAG: hypothetical protein SGJ20_08745 [Planctomycetota bacterium]|nr:hypothetical protein [Planctomycetota bacterium]
MKKVFKALAICALGSLILGGWSNSAWAIKEFETEFMDLYFKKDSKDPKQKAFAEEVIRISTETEGEDGPVLSSCNVCHVKGKAKKFHNEYGINLVELLDKKADKKDKKKIQEAIKKVGGMKSNDGPTYDDLIKEGKLPGDPEKVGEAAKKE